MFLIFKLIISIFISNSRYFIESCDGEVLDLTDYDADEIRLLAMKFKKDIKDNDWREPNGQSITVPVY